MSRQEILAWTSAATSLAILLLYVIGVFGWPALFPDYSGEVKNLLFNILWIAIALEIAAEVIKRKGEVEKDERDFEFEAHGNRYAYTFLAFGLAVLLVNMFISGYLAELNSYHAAMIEPETLFHILFILLFLSNIIKRSTQLYFYRRGL